MGHAHATRRRDQASIAKSGFSTAGPEFDILAGQTPPTSAELILGAVMRSHQIATRVAAFALFLSAETPASAQGTEQQRQACTPDVFRLCGAYIPDADRITACLRGNGPQLSQPCYNVFFPPQPPPQYAPPQDRDPRRRYQRSAPGPYYQDDDD